MGMAMQGSGISGMDVGSATLKVNDEGFYSLLIGAADMGTGCDTTLAQIAAEVLDCRAGRHHGASVPTPTSSPYDSGSYASSTTYVTGKADRKVRAEAARHKSARWAQSCSAARKEQVGLRRQGSLSVEEGEDAGKTINLSDVAIRAPMYGHMRARCRSTELPTRRPCRLRRTWWVLPRSSWTQRPARSRLHGLCRLQWTAAPPSTPI